MAHVKARIVNTKKASIRKTPWITGDTSVARTVNGGEAITIDTEKYVYDLADVKYYAVLGILGAVDGYISEEVILIRGG